MHCNLNRSLIACLHVIEGRIDEDAVMVCINKVLLFVNMRIALCYPHTN